MEKRMTFTQFITHTLVAFSTVLLFLMVVGPLIGNEAQGTSTLFALGAQGIPYVVLLQALVLATYCNTVQVLFMSRVLFKKMMLLWRTVWMFACVLIGVGALSVLFGWFPANEPRAWISYLLCFALASGLSTLVMVLKTRHDNARVNKKLEEYKQHKREGNSPSKGA